ncbi:MAG: dual specificity protein phosphatase [Myxococcaceae bacterium]
MDALRSTKLEPESSGGTPEERTPTSSNVDSFGLSPSKSQTFSQKFAHFKEKAYFYTAFHAGNLKIGQEKNGQAGADKVWHNEIKYSKYAHAKKLYLGRLPDDLQKRGINGPVKAVSLLQNFEAEHMDSSLKNNENRTVVNAEDNVGMKPDIIDSGVKALNDALTNTDDTRPVYLHCKSGVGRSATVLAAYLMTHQGMSFDDAINLVQRDRPEAQLRTKGGDDTKHTKALRAWALINHSNAGLIQ